MQQDHIDLPEWMKAVFTVDHDRSASSAYPFRLLVARSYERRTVYSVFKGQLGLADSAAFKASLQELCSEPTSKIIVDFSALSLTKTAMGALVRAAAFVHGLNKRLYLYATSAQIMALLHELDLTPFFNYLENENSVYSTLVI